MIGYYQVGKDLGERSPYLLTAECRQWLGDFFRKLGYLTYIDITAGWTTENNTVLIPQTTTAANNMITLAVGGEGHCSKCYFRTNYLVNERTTDTNFSVKWYGPDGIDHLFKDHWKDYAFGYDLFFKEVEEKKEVLKKLLHGRI